MIYAVAASPKWEMTDYIKMDRPAVYLPPMPVKGLYGSIGAPTLPKVCRGSKAKSDATKLDSCFIQDINITDGTVMALLTPLTKIWRMRNNGKVAWSPKTLLVWFGGDKIPVLCNKFSVEVKIPAAGLPVDQEIDVEIDLVASERPGEYTSDWRMVSRTGKYFGQCVWVVIQVDGSDKKMQHGNVRGFNRNLPPSCKHQHYQF